MGFSRWIFAVMAVVGIGSQQARAQSPSPFVDVALEAHALRGQVLDASGGACPGRMIVVEQKGRVVGEARSNAEGFFRVEGIKGGVYSVSISSIGAGEASIGCRAWPERMAPPAAKPAILITEGAPLARGQNRLRSLVRTGAICTAVGAGIAVPLLLIDQEDDLKSGS